MKRIIFTIAILIFSCMTAFAQINSKILDSTLGQTKKSKVKEILRKRNYAIVKETETTIIISNCTIPFGGIAWTDAVFEFDKGVLYKITLLTDYSNEEDALSTYQVLEPKYMAKYSSYLSDVEMKYNVVRHRFFSDGETVALIALMSNGLEYNCAITYYNLALANKNVIKVMDEI